MNADFQQKFNHKGHEVTQREKRIRTTSLFIEFSYSVVLWIFSLGSVVKNKLEGKKFAADYADERR
jgi:hypothetical protein